MRTRSRQLIVTLGVLAIAMIVAPASAQAAASTNSGNCAKAKQNAAGPGPLTALCARDADLLLGAVDGRGKSHEPSVTGATQAQAVTMLQLPNPLDIPGAIVDEGLDAAAGAVASGVGGILDEMAKKWGEEVGGVISWVTKKLVKSAKPKVSGAGTTWFRARYTDMMAIAAALSLIVVMAALIGGAIRGEAGQMAQAVLINWPASFFAMAVALGIVQLGLDLTTALSAWSLAGYEEDLKDMGAAMVSGFGSVGNPASPLTFPGGLLISLIVGLLAVVGALLIWIELLVRDAAVYLTLLMLPLGCMVAVWPPAKSVARKMAVLLLVVISAPFFIVTIFGFGAHMIAATSTDDLTRLITGAIIMFLAAATPTMLLKVLPFDEFADSVSRPNVPLVAQMQMSNMLSRSMSGGGGGGGGGGDAPENGADPAAHEPQGGAPNPNGGGPSGGGPSGGGAGSGGAGAGGGAEAGAAAGTAGGPAGIAVGAAVGTAAAGGQAAADRAQTSAEGATSGPGTNGYDPGPNSGSIGVGNSPPPHAAAQDAGGRSGFGGGPSEAQSSAGSPAPKNIGGGGGVPAAA